LKKIVTNDFFSIFWRAAALNPGSNSRVVGWAVERLSFQENFFVLFVHFINLMVGCIYIQFGES